MSREKSSYLGIIGDRDEFPEVAVTMTQQPKHAAAAKQLKSEGQNSCGIRLLYKSYAAMHWVEYRELSFPEQYRAETLSQPKRLSTAIREDMKAYVLASRTQPSKQSFHPKCASS